MHATNNYSFYKLGMLFYSIPTNNDTQFVKTRCTTSFKLPCRVSFKQRFKKFSKSVWQRFKTCFDIFFNQLYDKNLYDKCIIWDSCASIKIKLNSVKVTYSVRNSLRFLNNSEGILLILLYDIFLELHKNKFKN